MKDMTQDDQIKLTKAVMSIIDGWELSTEQILSVLALPEKTPGRALRRYRENTPFPGTPEVLERLEHIIGITDALRTSYPHNPQMVNHWLKQASKHLNNRIPLQVIVEGGLEGMIEVRSHLDCSYDWHNRP